MKSNFHIKSAVEMLDIFFKTLSPFDIVMAKYFRNNKWIGSHDRRKIADFSYSIFRNYEKIKFYLSNLDEKSGRYFVFTFLKVICGKSDDEICNAFSEDRDALFPLSVSEKEFLANLEMQKTFPKNVELNYPEWLEEYLKKVFCDENTTEFDDEMLAMNEKADLDIRVNSLKTEKESVKKMLAESGFSFVDAKYSMNGIRILNGRIGRNHDLIAKGLVEIQDEGSQLVAEFCDVCSNDVLVDFCAGAGGKTLAISAIMKNKGRIFALDKYPERLENAKLRFRRAGVNNVFCQEITGKWLKRHPGCAGVVLVDAPCSGTGTWRRNPDMRVKFSKKDLEELLLVQADILEKAKKLVKKGGRLVYATCSILMDENEDQINKFIKKFPEFVVDQKSKNERINSILNSKGYLRLSPFRNGTDGFFAVSMTKIS